MSVMVRRRFIELALAKACLLVVGCGTMMYPERRGQPGGRLDWRVVALDAAGLLLFFIPGVIAFAVDFTNGTIYLPPEEYYLPQEGYIGNRPGEDDRRFVEVKLPDEPITASKLEEIVSQHAQREIQLTPGAYQTEALETIDDFWAAWDTHRVEQTPG